jgi:hypothetical protein
MATSINTLIRIEPSARQLDQLAERSLINPSATSASTPRSTAPAASADLRREQGADYARSERAKEERTQALTKTAIKAIEGEKKNPDGSDKATGLDINGPGEIELFIKEPPRLPTPPDTRPIILKEGLPDHMTIKDIQEMALPHLVSPLQTALKGYETANRDFLVPTLNVKS